VDSIGDIYFTDYSNSSVRKITKYGVLSTISTGLSNVLNNGVAVDSSGNVFLVHDLSNSATKVFPNGTKVTLVAPSQVGNWGNGSSHIIGDGSSALSAKLKYPVDIAVDSQGVIYIADYFRIRKIDKSGIITTVAGNGSDSYSSASENSRATACSIPNAYKLALDSNGNIYYATERARIGFVSSSGIYRTFAGPNLIYK